MPSATDYCETIQSPASCFFDGELQRGRIDVDAVGLPRARCGRFATVFKIHDSSARVWAVKCYHLPVPGLRERYQAIGDHLRHVRLPMLVDFLFLDQGIRVGSKWYPILKM